MSFDLFDWLFVEGPMQYRNGRKLSGTQKWAFVSALLLGGAAARGDNFFWGDNGGATVAPGITPSIFLSDDNVAMVDQFLAGQAIKAVKIAQDVSPATISAIYNKYNVNYTFADFETLDAATKTANLVSQIKASQATGPAFSANQSYVSNFAFTPSYFDNTSPTPTSGYASYASAGVNMTADVLYPGSPGFRNPASGNSTAPNIRSALFTLPIVRLSMTSASMPAGNAHVAYVDRFNNWQNSALDTDGDPTNGYRFVTQNQLLSRGDFQAQILHYRLRGATGVQGLQGGVEGYTPEQFQSDINTGWNGTDAVNQILADPKARFATLDTQIKADGVTQPIENVGVVYSGAYSLSQGRLVLLLSNLDEQMHAIGFPSSIGGKAVPGEFDISAGSHELLQFDASGSKWDLTSSTAVFQDDNRAGVGVPEPTTIALAVGAVVVAGLRRRRR
jgi:hypothetical protein